MCTKKIAIGNKLPLASVTNNWFITYTALVEKEENHVLLESGRGGRYSIIGMKPWAIIKGKNKEMTIETKDGTEMKKGPLLESLREWLSFYEIETNDDLPDFQGGIIGQFSYDLIREIERLPEDTEDDLGTYDVHFMAFDDIVVIDHMEEMIWFITLTDYKQTGECRLKHMEELWRNDSGSAKPWYHQFQSKPTVEERSFTEDKFIEAVEKTRNYIAAGDVFQVNLSVRETRQLETHPLHIYDCLRKINPSPYMGYFHTPELQLVGGSPELLVKVSGDEVSTRPIAGTRSRGKNEEEDQALANTLINNEKERAEHVMLVDLERNDIGRVCKYGTVEVNELMVIEKYSHVMHIVSNVRGKKADQYDLMDVIAATFPGGTITGAPKIRTMEIIEELEPVRRGVYTGSLGWIGFNGDMELNITIRTMVAKSGKVHVQAGAGIVIDSNPMAEYKESLKKAKALWKAKELSEEEQKQKLV
ncbi:anthranilate synthase component I family protein [Evansella cellulosilytica]|uniref:Anthranilate synthase n=1 Tax=Evansella cellulosilytica (strain ATCC 21833 / DSM 2522 / FERM P-1141 / JCM 9156 / N-4) TaxID=649639 RepID=E6TSF0_EVAC2|nr:anthranilate synthase component I family protein [Evansella cellulosilytica]ADU28365.1 Anthranilate synthase [Evansella cellulosilytica DSM 2522]